MAGLNPEAPPSSHRTEYLSDPHAGPASLKAPDGATAGSWGLGEKQSCWRTWPQALQGWLPAPVAPARDPAAQRLETA
ncbi:hypothetical protein QTO34_012921 [Cnephaeus nilssonii]|uniref:Uncharacterized protein n=1 Tax=Cnephaeus nilssonii TaxID=3371016 RepID=A0AA40LD36_CNENI|nr:hypothetical protein QTO34_012921 [Eptesicus nilssonii]